MRRTMVAVALALLALTSALAQQGLRSERAQRADVNEPIIEPSLDFAQGLSGSTASLPGTSPSTGLKLRVGYQLNRHFALEGRYTDFTSAWLSDPLAVAPRATPYANSWNVAGVGTLALSQGLRVTGKLGLSYARPDRIDPTRYANLDGAAGLTWGAGVEYDFTPNLGIQGHVERLGETGDNFLLNRGVEYGRQSLISGALRYRF